MTNNKNDIGSRALELHRKLKGKIEVKETIQIKNMDDLALVYTPGVGTVASEVAKNPQLADEMTWKKNVVAVVSDGSAVLGLGNIGPLGALPVMEGKSVIFKQFASINAVPIVLDTQDQDEIVRTVIAIAPTFGAIQLEDISAPRCFEIERRIAEALSIPVMHDDQHGTAIVVLAGLINALKIVNKKIDAVRIVLSGAGAAGTAIAKILKVAGAKTIIVCDSKGAIWDGRPDLPPHKQELAKFTNPNKQRGSLGDMIKDADIVIGTSAPGIITSDMVRSMNERSIVFALANPVPEIMPDEALSAGAAVIATGRSDFPNQVNNALCYPGLFRGMLDGGVRTVSDEIKLRAAQAIADFIPNPTPKRFIPTMFDKGLHELVAQSVQ